MEFSAGWFYDLQSALETAHLEGKGVMLQFHRDECMGCRKMYARTYSDPDVQKDLFKWFVPLRQDILGNRDVRSKYFAYWTPSFYFLDYRGNMRHYFNGFLNAEDFRVLLRLAKAALDIPRGRYIETMDLMDEGLELFPHNPRASSLLFTRGMAEYLLGKERSSFREAMTEIRKEYPNSPEARMWPWMDEE